MANGFKGLSNVLTKVKNVPKSVRKEIAEELEATSQIITYKAVSKAPVSDGALRNAIGENLKELTATNFVNIFYAPYVEFGTKTKVNVPEKLQAYAKQFQGGTGKSAEEAKEQIFLWCKKKGIPEEAWGAVFWSIISNGIKPQPFFFSSWFEESDKLKPKLKEILTRIKEQIK